MSTSNPVAPAVPGVQGELGGAPLVTENPAALGLPSAEAITQLANALFSALPGRPAVPGTAADVQAAPPVSALPAVTPAPGGELASLPAAAYVPPTSGFAPPGDAELRAAPASLAGLGGVASPATAANPSGDPAYYFLQPEGAALPGAAVGIGPSSAARLESGALPTSPSPPAAFAQPAEPGIGSMSGIPGGVGGLASVGGASAPAPFAFRPELVPDATPVPLGGGSFAPTPVPQAALPQEAGAMPPAADIPPLAAAAPDIETGPRGTVGGPGLPPLGGAPTASSFYFLEEAGPHYGSGVQETGGIPGLIADPYGFPFGPSDVETSAYPFDSRRADGDGLGQPSSVGQAPTGGAPVSVPGHEAANHPLRVDNASPPGITGVGLS
ncbi:MAG: hypothetical protein ACOYMG_02050 [Candidatus Methylumidiphilus sp.]